MSDALYGRGLYPFVGLSTDANSPTSDPAASTWAKKPLPGQKAVETDTGEVYQFFGSWGDGIPIGTIGSSDRPLPPQNQKIKGTAVIASTGLTGAVIYTSGLIDGFSYSSFENLSPADAIQIFGSLDGINFNATPLRVKNFHNTTASTTLLAGQTGILEHDRSKWLALKVRKSGSTAEVPSVKYLHGNL